MSHHVPPINHLLPPTCNEVPLIRISYKGNPTPNTYLLVQKAQVYITNTYTSYSYNLHNNTQTPII